MTTVTVPIPDLPNMPCWRLDPGPVSHAGLDHIEVGLILRIREAKDCPITRITAQVPVKVPADAYGPHTAEAERILGNYIHFGSLPGQRIT